MTELTRTVARRLLAPILAVAAAVLVKGYADVGDGFAAGLVASLGVLLQYSVFGRDAVYSLLPVRHAERIAFAGLGIAVAVAMVPLLRGEPPLAHAPAPGAHVTTIGTLELTTAVAFDAGVFLLVVGATVTIIDRIAAVPPTTDAP